MRLNKPNRKGNGNVLKNFKLVWKDDVSVLIKSFLPNDEVFERTIDEKI